MSALTLLSGETWVQRLGWVLVHFLWQGASIGLFLALGLRLLGNVSAQVRYLLICGALLACGLAPLVTWTVLAQGPGIHSATAPGFTDERATTDASLDAPTQVDVSAAGQVAKAPETTMAGWQEIGARVAGLLLPGAVALWLTGVLFLTLRLMFGWLDMQRLRHSGVASCDEAWQERFGRLAKRMRVSVPVRLLESALVEVPTLIGWIRPVILVPATAFAGLAPDQLEAILAHELAHVRRYDYLVNLLQTAIEIALFYHPAVWWIGRKLREERENCCDDMALEVMTDRLVYVSALAQLEQVRSMPLVLSAAGGPLLQRIRRLVRAEDRKASAWPLLVLMAGFFIACVVVVRAQTLRESASARSNILAPGSSSGEASGAPSDSAALFAAMKRIHLPPFKVTGTPLPNFVREFQALLRDSDPKKEGIELLLSLPEGEPPASISLTFEPDTTVLYVLDKLSNNYHIRYQIRDNRIELRQPSLAEIAFGRGSSASISVHFNQVAVPDALHTIQALAAAKGFAFKLEGLDALKATVPVTFQDDSVSVDQAVRSVCYLGGLSAAPLNRFAGYKVALDPNEATALMITGDAINMKRKVLQNDKDGVRFEVIPRANCWMGYSAPQPEKSVMIAYTTGDDISRRDLPRLILTYTYQILDKTSLQFNGTVELKDRQGNTLDTVTGQWTQRFGTRVRLVFHGQPTVRLPQPKEIPPVGAEIDDGYYFYVTARSLKFPGGESLMPPMAGNKFIDVELAVSGDGGGNGSSPRSVTIHPTSVPLPVVPENTALKSEAGPRIRVLAESPGVVRKVQSPGANTSQANNLAAVPVPVIAASSGPHIQIGLQLAEIEEGVYRANRGKIDQAIADGDVSICNQLKGISLLSPPSVSTAPGTKANIAILQEMPFATGYNIPKLSKAPLTPTEFETKDVGVSAEVTPRLSSEEPSRESEIILNGFFTITQFDGFTPSNLGKTFMPSFTTSETHFIEALHDKDLHGLWLPGVHFRQGHVWDGPPAQDAPMVQTRYALFLRASLVKN